MKKIIIIAAMLISGCGGALLSGSQSEFSKAYNQYIQFKDDKRYDEINLRNLGALRYGCESEDRPECSQFDFQTEINTIQDRNMSLFMTKSKDKRKVFAIACSLGVQLTGAQGLIPEGYGYRFAYRVFNFTDENIEGRLKIRVTVIDIYDNMRWTDMYCFTPPAPGGSEIFYTQIYNDIDPSQIKFSNVAVVAIEK